MEGSSNALENKENDKNKLEEVNQYETDSITLSEYLQHSLKSMPHTLKNRIHMLKNLQMVFNKMRIDYYREIFDLERKYHNIQKDIYILRAKIISGEVNPKSERPTWKNCLYDNEQRLISKFDFATTLTSLDEIPKNVKGIPDFWLTIFLSYEPLSQMIYDHDITVLKELIDIQLHYENTNSFTLEFHFNPNRYFFNEVLTKKYFLKNSIDKSDPFELEALEIIRCTGCKIFWRNSMNLNMSCIRIRDMSHGLASGRWLIRQIPQKTFFSYFTTGHSSLQNYQPMDEELKEDLRIDFAIGRFLRKQIIPRAVLYYTGDMNDEDFEMIVNENEKKGVIKETTILFKK